MSNPVVETQAVETTNNKNHFAYKVVDTGFALLDHRGKEKN